MQATKTMVAVIATFIFTAMFIGFFCYLLSDNTSYKQVMQNGGLWMFMLVLGWIPSVIVGIDIDQKQW